MHHLPEVHRKCSCKTFWSTFLVLLFERACCSYVPLHVLIRQWAVHPGRLYFTVFEVYKKKLKKSTLQVLEEGLLCGWYALVTIIAWALAARTKVKIISSQVCPVFYTSLLLKTF